MKESAMPPDIQVLTDLNELVALLSVFEQTFDIKDFQRPGDAHLSTLLESRNFIAIAARVDGRVIGGLTVHVLNQYYSVKPLAYLYDVAVLPAFQRRGVGKALMAFTTDYCRQHGFEEAYVQAERADREAVDFYRATNPTAVVEATQFSYRLR